MLPDLNRRLSEHAACNPGAPALRHGADLWSYGELEREVARLASALWTAGVRPGMALAHNLSPLTTVLLLHAALRLGIACLPLATGTSPERRNRLLQQSGCSFLIAAEEDGELPPEIALLPEAALRKETEPLPMAAPSAPSPDATQLIIATSGTTGEPRGVMLTQSNLAAAVHASQQRLKLEAGDRWLNCLPLHHIGGASILYRCLGPGACMELHDRFDVGAVWSALQQHDITHISLVPPMLDRLLELAGSTPPAASLRVALLGGGPLDPELARRAHTAGWPLCVSYGMSETGSQLATDCGNDSGLEEGSVGMPLEGFEVARSEHGILRVRGPAVMAGYANPERRPGVGIQEQGWLETGDLGEVDTTGRLRILGRADDLLVVGGKTIHPLEVEQALRDCPGLGPVAVAARPDPVWGHRLVAFYCGAVAAAEAEAWVREHLPNTLRPREFICVKDLPKNQMAKLDRNALRAMLNK